MNIEFEEQLKKNQDALALLQSLKNEVISDQERHQRKIAFESLKEIIDSNRLPGKGAFSQSQDC
jgi:hypothetical protein